MSLIQQVSGTTGQLGTSGIGKLASHVASRGLGAAGSAATIGLRAAENALGIRFDPAPTYLFYIELSGVIVGLFTECSGIEVERKVDTITEGGVNDHVNLLPGRVVQSNITLKRGLSLSRALWDWFQQGRYDFHARRINFSIIQGAPSHNLLTNILPGDYSLGASFGGAGGGQQGGAGFGKVKHWDVEDAFPIKWESSGLKTADNKSLVIETVKIAHHGLTLSYEVGTPLSPAASVLGTQGY